MDVRKYKTQKALVKALMSLLERKVWQKITIKDICQEALVSRSTFYLHFADKYELFEYMLDRMDEVVTEDLMRMDMRELLLTRFTQMKKNERIVKNLMRVEPEQDLLALFYRHFQTVTQRYIERRGASIDEDTLQIIAGFYGTGIASTIMTWFLHDQDISVEKMVDTLVRIIEPAEQFLSDAIVFDGNL